MRECEFEWSDGDRCYEIAVAHIESSDGGRKWYCVEHYDLWAKWYQENALHDTAHRRICRINGL